MKKGFTLIEAIIYIALLGLMMGGVLPTVYQILQSSGNVSGHNTVQEEGNFVLRKIDWALTGTSTQAKITVPTPGTYANTLDLIRADGNRVQFRLKNNSIEMSEGAGAFASTTSSNVEVNALQFYHIPPSGTGPGGIEVSTTINGIIFTTTKYIRQ